MARQRFAEDELVLVGTLRGDGWPRISPNELDFVDGELVLGMMWQSRKALDLQRDPRLVVHSAPHGRMNAGGDIKLYGTAHDSRDPDLRAAYRATIQARIDWAPQEPNYHCFTFDIERASYIVFGDDRRLIAWDPQRGLRELAFPPD